MAVVTGRLNGQWGRIGAHTKMGKRRDLGVRLPRFREPQVGIEEKLIETFKTSKEGLKKTEGLSQHGKREREGERRTRLGRDRGIEPSNRGKEPCRTVQVYGPASASANGPHLAKGCRRRPKTVTATVRCGDFGQRILCSKSF